MAAYSKKASAKVERAMEEMKDGTLKSGHSEKPVTNPKQAIAIGLSEARAEGAKVPTKKAPAKKSPPKKSVTPTPSAQRTKAKKPMPRKAVSKEAATKRG